MPYSPKEPRDNRGRWTGGAETVTDRYARTFYPDHPTESDLRRRSARLANTGLSGDDTPQAAPRPPVQVEDLPPSPGQEGCPVAGGGYCPWGSGKGGSIPGTSDPMPPIPGLVPGTRDQIPTAGNSDWDKRKMPSARR